MAGSEISLIRRRTKPPVLEHRRVSFEDVLSRLEDHGRPHDAAFLKEAHDFSKKMHEGQMRRSGKPYFSHPLAVAYILADLRFDESCVAVGLLHDVLEDTLTTREVLAQDFGEEVAELVNGVTKIGRHAYTKRDEAQAETFRKLILASAKDVRVIIVKLADRLHNMQTLEYLSADARRRISLETHEIYAPIAHRLGMSKLQGDLEDLAFYHLYTHQFASLRRKVRRRLKLGKTSTDLITSQLTKTLEESGLDAEISFRVKRYYSIYRKLRRLRIDISQLYDYLAYRIVCANIGDCYSALGVVHQNWRPVPGRFKDYIAMPKPNLYQSLHTTVVGSSGQPFEVQIRTAKMDAVAEEGIAAHWRYKEDGSIEAAGDQNILWLRQLLDWQQEIEDPRTYMTTLKIDLYPDEVYAFSPKGEVFSFPRGATPLDFAYKIHTDLGHHCVRARVNGKLVPLRTVLQNGDIVAIDTNAKRTPSVDWLKLVATSRAKSKIRHWLNAKQKQRAVEIGKPLFERELKRHKVSLKKVLAGPALAEYLTKEGLVGIEHLYSRIGYGKTPVSRVLDRILRPDQLAVTAEEPGRLRQAVAKMLPFGGAAIKVKGHGDLLAYLAKCCSPLPGEHVVGYITRGRGVSVHSTECPNVKDLLYNPDREIEVEWGQSPNEVFPIVLTVETEDEQGMLAKLTEVIAKQQGNIKQIEAETFETGRGVIEVVVEVRNRKHLDRLQRKINSIEGVLQVDRAMAGRAREPQNLG